MISLSLVRYVLMAATRDRLLPVMLVVMAVAFSLSFLTGGTAIIEKGQFALVFAAAAVRFCGVLGLVLFVVFFVRRSFENKDVEYLLSRPISRTSFILSHAAAFSLLALIVGCVSALAICGLSPYGFKEAGLFWSASLIAEFVIMVNAALFFSMVLQAGTSGVMATLALYVLARLMGELLGIIDHTVDTHAVALLGKGFEAISLIVPRLDLLAQTSWLIYGHADVAPLFILAQTAAYTALLLSAATVDLSRRQF